MATFSSSHAGSRTGSKVFWMVVAQVLHLLCRVDTQWEGGWHLCICWFRRCREEQSGTAPIAGLREPDKSPSRKPCPSLCHGKGLYDAFWGSRCAWLIYLELWSWIKFNDWTDQFAAKGAQSYAFVANGRRRHVLAKSFSKLSTANFLPKVFVKIWQWC